MCLVGVVLLWYVSCCVCSVGACVCCYVSVYAYVSVPVRSCSVLSRFLLLRVGLCCCCCLVLCSVVRICVSVVCSCSLLFSFPVRFVQCVLFVV